MFPGAKSVISFIMDPIPTPHDRFFRESFGHREIAQDFLSHQLPEDLLAEIDLETLAIGKDSYISKELRTSYSDFRPHLFGGK